MATILESRRVFFFPQKLKKRKSLLGALIGRARGNGKERERRGRERGREREGEGGREKERKKEIDR